MDEARGLEEWALIEQAGETKVESLAYLQLALAAHGYALERLKKTELGLIFAVRRAVRARRHAARAGRLLTRTVRLMELT